MPDLPPQRRSRSLARLEAAIVAAEMRLELLWQERDWRLVHENERLGRLS
jgi:hypothetical protein